MASITHTTVLWYASRATGVVSLLLLSAVLVIGMTVNRQERLPGLPRFAVSGLHRNLSLLSVAFLAVHVAAAIADPYVSIGALAAVIPFTAPYLPLWLGLGAVAADLIIALILTSLLRARIGRRAWRGVHWAAYGAWPVAFAHGVGASPDLRTAPLRTVAIGCALAVGAAVTWRITHAMRETPRPERAAAVLAASQPRPRQAAQPAPGHVPPSAAGPTAGGRR